MRSQLYEADEDGCLPKCDTPPEAGPAEGGNQRRPRTANLSLPAPGKKNKGQKGSRGIDDPLRKHSGPPPQETRARKQGGRKTTLYKLEIDLLTIHLDTSEKQVKVQTVNADQLTDTKAWSCVCNEKPMSQSERGTCSKDRR